MKIEEEIKQPRFKNEVQKLILNLMYTSNWLGIRQIQFFREFGISPQQYNVLRILRGQYPNPACINVLMDRMLDKTSNASRLVDKLEIKNLVERRRSIHDKRMADVLITAEGLDLLSKIDKVIDGVEKTYVNLSEDEIRKMNDMLDKFRG